MNKICLLLLMFYTVVEAQEVIIQTDKGKVEGYITEDNAIRIYKGIPYAAPPTGILRWRAPREHAPWDNVLSCKEFSASPIQNEPRPFYCWTEEFIAQPEPLSEDCLYLNIWSSAKKEAEKLPVFVWIYGGGFVSGSSNCAIYDGEELARKGVVFVSINYRVGALGFLAHPELSKESGYSASGNYGILDQIKALEWIQKNIYAFGGDPDNVTIAGQSAGSFSVNVLIASPLAKGLFHKAILQSGGLISNRLTQPLELAENQGVGLMKAAGVNSLEELRKLPASRIQELSSVQSLGRYGITLDDYLLPANLPEHFRQRKHQLVPLLAGWVTGDGALFGSSNLSVKDYEEESKKLYGEYAEEYLKIFPAATTEEVTAAKGKVSMLNFAALPAHRLALSTPQKSFLYEFSHVPVDKPGFPNYGAFHSSEVAFALHSLHTWKRPWRDIDWYIQNLMSSYWVNFARTGNPNGEGLPLWKAYNEADGPILSIGTDIQTKEALLKKEIDFLNKVTQ